MTFRFVIALAVVAFAAASGAAAHDAAFGKPVNPGSAQRTIEVEMSDAMRFLPARILVKRGERVRFAVRNAGQLAHEMVLGTMQDLKEHAEMMKKHPDMQHDDPHMLRLAPGKAGTLAWQFTRAGEFYYGCLVPGHFDAGMVGTIVVQ